LNLVPKFGTVVEKNDINKGGLSTAEVDLNMTLPFELMRETEVSSSDTTTPIHYDARIAIVGSDPVTLTLDHATYKGCTITITNRNTEQATIVLSEDNEKHLESKQSLVLKWDGTAWIDTALVVDSTVSEESNNPVTSAAVHQKATEITEAYTQAIADETNSRGEAIAEEQRLREEAITAAEQKIEEETTARTEADTALGTRIDEEVTARTEADTKLTQQIEAIEQLHNALVSNAEGFVDSDGDTVTVEDSGKTIRQIAHEEFYRQLITDAADVQTQIDTLKELADYLQTNPSVIADMYSKLGITWSVDNLTDFGTFDFSGVLTATNVDDAILELYNTFTEKFGELTSLETSAKDNIVAAINELNTKIGEEVTARTDADSELGTRIDGEVTAREEADTELDNKITQLGTNVGQLDSLTTEEKTSTVAAINELHNLIETSTDTLTVVCEIDDTAERTVGHTGIVYTQGKIEDIDTLSQQVADNKPVQLILKSKNYMPYGFIALTSYILRPSGVLNFSGYIDETQIEDEETSPVRSANKTCIHINVDTRTGNVSIEDVDIKDVFINVVFEGDIGTEDVIITKTLSAYDIRLINNLKTGKNASVSAKFSFGGIEVTTSNYDVSDDKILFTGEANIGDRLVSYKVIISSESTDNCRLEIGKSATEQLSGVAGEVNTLKESVSELGTDVEALKSAAPSEPVDAYTKTEVDGKFDNVYTKTEVDDKFSEVGSGDTAAANCEQFTFVVDSNEKLAEWANNDRSKGQDYTSVLIRKGEWTGTKGVNLTTAGTKVVKGEAGSKLRFNDIENALFYKSLPITDDYYMHNITVEVTITIPFSGNNIFFNIRNLKNCYGKNTNSNCIDGYVYKTCKNLVQCTGVTESTGLALNNYGFRDCESILHCNYEGNINVPNDTSAKLGSRMFGFAYCRDIRNCMGNVNANGGTGEKCYIFYFCKGVMQSRARALTTGTYGYGFSGCNSVHQCSASGKCTSDVFEKCYASNANTAEYACADTPAGGFNDTTNPSA
jgi:hypothetical protein